MADFTYGAVLKLIRVIERAGIDSDWLDFWRAYGLPSPPEPARRPTAGYGDYTIEEERMNLLRRLARHMDQDTVKRTFVSLAGSVLAELDDPGYDHLGRRRIFFDDTEAALDDLEALKRQLQEDGYTIEAGRLVADDMPPAEAELDAVTGIGNRAYLDREAAKIWEQCQTGGAAAAAIFIEIDDFGVFNKQYSHAMGDRVLRAVAQTIQRCVWLRGATLGRYGGDEIIVIMRNLTEAETKVLGERIREDVENLHVEGLSVTVSVGVASIQGGSLGELWDKADKAQRGAKKDGKNRTVAFSELPSAE